jgi:hypothetical protein
MYFKKNREGAFLPVFAAALGVFLVAEGGAFAAGHSPVMMHAEAALAANPQMGSSCQVVLDATEKLFTTPFHMYSTQATDGVQNGKPMSGEMVFVGGPDTFWSWASGRPALFPRRS